MQIGNYTEENLYCYNKTLITLTKEKVIKLEFKNGQKSYAYLKNGAIYESKYVEDDAVEFFHTKEDFITRLQEELAETHLIFAEDLNYAENLPEEEVEFYCNFYDFLIHMQNKGYMPVGNFLKRTLKTLPETNMPNQFSKSHIIFNNYAYMILPQSKENILGFPISSLFNSQYNGYLIRNGKKIKAMIDFIDKEIFNEESCFSFCLNNGEVVYIRPSEISSEEVYYYHACLEQKQNNEIQQSVNKKKQLLEQLFSDEAI